MKKSLSLLVAIAMVFSMFATLVSAAETKSAGEQLKEYGIINGTSEGLEEGAEWLRKDVTVLLARLLQVEEKAENTENTHGFADLDSKFYNGYVSWAKTEGFFNGLTATEFGPNDSITNQQFAAVLLRALGVKDVDYADVFTKAVELELVSADLAAKDNAVRGDIYTALVTALDFKIDGKKLGTILGIKGFEITDLAVVKATAPNQKTVKVEFNNDLGTVTANNFGVVRADNDSVQIIQSVSVEGVVATITLVDALAVDKDYVVTATNVSDKEATSVLASATTEFKYVKAVPVSIAFATTTIEQNKELKVLIKDADGNDITTNYASTDIEAVSSSSVVVVNATTGVITAAAVSGEAHAVVSAKLKGTELTTGNVIIYVKESLNTASSIGTVKLGNTTDPGLSIFKGSAGVIVADIVDAGNVSTTLNFSTHKANFKSLNPTVLVVDATTGAVQPVANGSATVVITGTIGGKTVSKSVVVTVKDDAKITSVSAEKSVINMVIGSGITGEIKLNVKDQYGNNVTTAANLDITPVATITGSATTVAYDNKGVATLQLSAVPVNTAKSTTVLTFKVPNTNISTSVTVNVVEKATFVGYAVELATTLDANTDTTDSNKKNPDVVTVKVYEKDSNGNYIAPVTAGVIIEKDSSDALTTNGTSTITASKAGSSVITVKVNNVVVGTYTITVLDTRAATVNKVAQNTNAITVTSGTTITEKLFGNATTGKGGAFTATNQFGTITPITGASVYSANEAIVNGSSLLAGTAGTVLLTVVANGQVFTINVVVTTP